MNGLMTDIHLGQDQNNKQYNQLMERIMNEACPYCGGNEIYEDDTVYDGAEMRQIFYCDQCGRVGPKFINSRE